MRPIAADEVCHEVPLVRDSDDVPAGDHPRDEDGLDHREDRRHPVLRHVAGEVRTLQFDRRRDHRGVDPPVPAALPRLGHQQARRGSRTPEHDASVTHITVTRITNLTRPS